jgi:2'-5' RNA ligase
MRLFVALDIDEAIRQRITEFRNQMRGLAPEVRWVSPETFHVTLQFLGESNKLEEIRRVLAQVKAEPVRLSFRNAGFFPNAKAARIFWAGIEADERLQGLVTSIGNALAPVGFEQEKQPYRPHLTLARLGSGRPRGARGEAAAPGLQRVRAKLETLPPPEFGTMTAREFLLYQSKLSPAGPQYTKLAGYALQWL